MLRHVFPGGAPGEEVALEVPAAGGKATFAVLGRPGGGATVCVPCGGPGSASARVSRRHGAFAVDGLGDVRFVALRPAVLVPRGRGAPRALPVRRPVRLAEGDAVAVGAVPHPLTRQRALEGMHAVVLAAAPARCDACTRDGVLACDICTEVLRGARVLPCGHSGCDDCLSRWLATNATCPTCRARVEPACAASAGWPCRALDALAEESAAREGDDAALAAARDYASIARFS